jgi:hypothetical protein
MKQPRPEVKGFFEPNLRLMNQYQRGYLYLFENPQRSVSELPEESPADIIWPQPVAKFETKDSIQLAQGSRGTQIGQQAVAQLPSAHNVILSHLTKVNWYGDQLLQLLQQLPLTANAIRSIISTSMSSFQSVTG